MGTHENLVCTIKPDQTPITDIVDRLDRLREAPLESLPDGDWDPDQWPASDRNFDRGRLEVEVDEAHGQVAFGGRTSSPSSKDAWKEWVLAGGIGDGYLAVTIWHENDRRGYGWVYQWNDSRGEYEELDVDCRGDRYGKGAISAHRINDQVSELYPARGEGYGVLTWDDAARNDDDFVPDSYFSNHDDPYDPSDGGSGTADTA